MTILLYRLHPQTQENIRRLLDNIESEVFVIQHEKTYDRAIQIIERQDCEVCIVEQHMLETDDYDALDFIQNVHRVQPYMPVILLTEDNQGMDMAALKSGAIDYLVKPFLTERNLERALRYAFERANLYKSLALDYENIQELNALKSQIIRIAAHDLRNPITSMLLSLDLVFRLQKHNAPSDKVEHHLKRVQNAARNMERIIAEILTLDYLDIDNDLLIGAIPLQPLIAEIVDLMTDAPENKKNLILQQPEEMIYIPGDYKQIQQVIRQMVENAHQRSPEMAPVVIRITDQIDTATVNIEIIDQGEAIGDALQDFVQKTFPQVYEEGHPAMWLYLCKRIIKRYGGKLIIYNKKPSGVAFGFSLPTKETTELPRLA